MVFFFKDIHKENLEFTKALYRKNIKEFFHVGDPKEGGLEFLQGAPDLKTLQSHYQHANPADWEFPLDLLPDFDSRNKFERNYYNSYFTLLPLTSLRIAKINPAFYLGIISRYSLAQNISRWNNDINLIIDQEGNLAGYDVNFLQAMPGIKPAINSPLGRYLDTGFLKQERNGTPPLLKGTGESLFNFPGPDGGRAAVSSRSLFKISPNRIQCSTLESPIPAFLRLPVAVDLAHHDYRLEIEAEEIRGGPPLFILNAGKLKGGDFPDDHGLLFGPITLEISPMSRNLRKKNLFILKKSGMIISYFEGFKEPGREDRISYSIVKKGMDLDFYINGLFAGHQNLFDTPSMPGNRFVVLGLRTGQSCAFTKIHLTRHEPDDSPGASAAPVTFILDKPENPYKVHSYQRICGVGGEDRIYSFLRLEDLKTQEKIEQLTRKISAREQEIERLREEREKSEGAGRIIGDSAPALRLKSLITSISRFQTPVLLSGETGTGKGLLAEILHQTSARKGGPFVKVDCAALPESLIESELFGHEKGAFTGAVDTVEGKFEQAQGGTLFLDEIANINLNVQAKLLNVLQDLVIVRLGGHKKIPVDIRVISATNAPLEKLVAEGRFRADLFYRLNVLQVRVPTLRDRLEDIPLICEHLFMNELKRHAHRVESVSPLVYQKLKQYDWPGNVRELMNVFTQAVVLCEHKELLPRHLSLPHVQESGTQEPAKGPVKKKRLTVAQILEEIKKCEGNVLWAAENLGLSRITLYRKLERAGVSMETAREKAKFSGGPL